MILVNRKVWAVLRREYVLRVRSRWFLFATFVLPAIMIGLVALVGRLAVNSTEGTGNLQLGVVDESGQVGGPLVESMAKEGISARRIPSLPRVPPDSLIADLEAAHLDGYLIVPADVLSDGVKLTVQTRREISEGNRARIEAAARRSLARARLQVAGIHSVDADELLEEPGVDVVRLGREGTSSEVTQAIGFIVPMLLYTMLLIYGQMITRGVMEEKTSDIVEVMVSSVRPWELLAGKIVGVGAVGLTQLAVWSLVVVGVSVYGLAAAAPALAKAGIHLGEVSVPITPVIASFFLFLFGYLLYAGLFAAGGAMLSNEQDVQYVMFPIIILIVTPIMVLQPVLNSPDSTWAVIMSLVPFFAPILLAARLAVGSVPIWQLLLAAGLLCTAIAGVTWLAGRIYRVGVLMKGKRPNLPEVWRWIRHG